MKYKQTIKSGDWSLQCNGFFVNLSYMNDHTTSSIQLFATIWAFEVFCLLVLYKYFFILKISLAVPCTVKSHMSKQSIKEFFAKRKTEWSRMVTLYRGGLTSTRDVRLLASFFFPHGIGIWCIKIRLVLLNVQIPSAAKTILSNHMGWIVQRGFNFFEIHIVKATITINTVFSTIAIQLVDKMIQ